MRGQRDMYANLNNQVLHLANQGVTINEIHNVYEPPKSLQKHWYARGYHGSYLHNSRAVIQRYLGFWDLNPATLVPLSPEDSAPLYVEMMGGADKVHGEGTRTLRPGQISSRDGDPEQARLRGTGQPGRPKICSPTPSSRWAISTRAPSLRNSFLAGAKELRDGVIAGESGKSRQSGLRPRHRH